MKYINLFILVIILCNCDTKSQQSKVLNIDSTKSHKNTIEIDSSMITQKLQVNTPNQKINIKNNNILLPFNYSIDESTGKYTFKWNLCDLIIDSESKDYSKLSFANNIPYKGYIGSEGKLHIIKTNNSNAITTQKFVKQHTELYKEILYSDDESIIFKTHSGAFSVLFYKYLNDKKSFSIFYKENKSVGFKATDKELLDLAISQLRVAKNLHKQSEKTDLLNWENYKKSLTILDKKVFKIIYKDIEKVIDSINTDVVYTPKIEGNWDLISITKTSDESENLWKSINNLPDNKVDFKEIYNTKLSDQIAYLRSSNKFLQVEYKDNSTLILKKEDRYDDKKIVYAVFSKLKIKNKEIIIFTGGYQNFGQVNSKEMAYFYFNLFKNYKMFANKGYK